jgi:hypothetical protein
VVWLELRLLSQSNKTNVSIRGTSKPQSQSPALAFRSSLVLVLWPCFCCDSEDTMNLFLLLGLGAAGFYLYSKSQKKSATTVTDKNDPSVWDSMTKYMTETKQTTTDPTLKERLDAKVKAEQEAYERKQKQDSWQDPFA